MKKFCYFIGIIGTIFISTMLCGCFGFLQSTPAITHSVLFYDSNNELVYTYTCKDNSLIQGSVFETVLPRVAKSRYVFDKWYLDSEFNQEFDPSAIIIADLNLYAKMIPTGDTGTLGLKYELNADNESYTVKKGTATINGTITISPTYLGKPITIIGNSAFSGCSNLTNISIPDTVTLISERAFYKCTSLTSINIPNSVEEIANAAFCECKSLNQIIFSENLKIIGNSAFYQAYTFDTLILPSKVEEIGEWALGCDKLKKLYIPKSVTKMRAQIVNPNRSVVCTIYCEASSAGVDWNSNWYKAQFSTLWYEMNVVWNADMP